MIQSQTHLNVADNSGARKLMCIRIIGTSNRRYAHIGDVIVAVIKEAAPNSPLERSEVIRVQMATMHTDTLTVDGVSVPCKGYLNAGSHEVEAPLYYLTGKVDTLIIGGGMAYTFFRAKGYSVGTSLCEEDKIELAASLMKKAEEKGVKFLLPIDNRLGSAYDENTDVTIVDSDSIPEGKMGLDIGPKTEALFAEAVKDAGTVIWNGPMGVSEWKNFASGTESVAKAVAESGAISIIGGGDSAAAVQKLGYADK